MQALCRLYVGSMQALCRNYVGIMQALCRLGNTQNADKHYTFGSFYVGMQALLEIQKKNFGFRAVFLKAKKAPRSFAGEVRIYTAPSC